MLRIRIVVFLLVVFQAVSSQTGLIIQGTSPNLHLVHTVVAKENWYSIGRIYNLSPKELAPYNKTTLDKPLSIGQLLKIPLIGTNFSQNGTKLPEENLIPLYHIVQEKEGMYRVSVTHNKVSADNLKKWNKLSSDQLKNGMKLIVGYLKVKGNESPFASAGSNKISVGGTEPGSTNTPSTNTSSTNTSSTSPTSNPSNPTSNTTNPTTNPTTNSSSTHSTTVPSSTVPPSKNGSTTTPAQTQQTPPVNMPVSSEQPSSRREEPASRPEVINTGNPASFKGGFFKNQYSESGKTTTGNAGIFKSTSGWNDGKYYALMNNVPIGTIIKVSFSSTNKSIFAKVLGQLPEMKESTGLAVRLSDAAASELGVAISKFYVDVKY